MKTVKLTRAGLFLAGCLFLSISFTAIAQKYPKVQEISLRAPGNIKIDGKLTEWAGKLQAYSYRDRIFYTISNDDENLYLTVQTGGPFANDKVLQGGITFTVSHAEGRERLKAPDNVSVKYPMLSERGIAAMVAGCYQYADLNNDNAGNKQRIDSLVTTMNKHIIRWSKEIQVIGVNEITDPLISIYNTQGIKVAGVFNDKMIYTYELAIPLKYLGISVTGNDKFSYNIKLNGPEYVPDGPVMIADAGPVATNANYRAPVMNRIGVPDPDNAYKENPTDFWGVYVLAKKQ